MKEYEFRAVFALDPPARADAVRRLLDGTRPQCVLQPWDGKWFPAAVSVRGSPSQGRPVHTVVRVLLLAGELVSRVTSKFAVLFASHRW